MERFDFIHEKHNLAEEKTDEFKADSKAFRQLKTVTEIEELMSQVIPGVDRGEIEDDNGERTATLPEIPSDWEATEAEAARTVFCEQCLVVPLCDW